MDQFHANKFRNLDQCNTVHQDVTLARLNLKNLSIRDFGDVLENFSRRFHLTLEVGCGREILGFRDRVERWVLP